MNYAKLMQLEIDKKRKLPDTVKNNISTNIFISLVGATIILAYLVAINLVYKNFDNNTFEEYMKYFALGIIIVTVLVFEIAYRKKSKKYTLIAIELLVCGCLSLYIPYIYLHTTAVLREGIMILPAVLIIYYAIKSYAIYRTKKFSYQNNLSDVKEIMRDKSEIESYLDENSDKTYRAKLEEEEVIKAQIKREQELRKKKKIMEKNRIANEAKDKRKKKAKKKKEVK